MPGMPWRVSEVRVLTDAIRRAMAPGEISLAGRTPIAVRRMAARLGLIGDGVSRKRWTASQRAKLGELVAAGWTATRIASANLLPHNRNAIQKQMQRMSLGRAERSVPQKAADRLAGPLLERFQAFITAQAKTSTPAQIAQLWNQSCEDEANAPRVSHRKVVYHLGQLGLRPLRRPSATVRMTYTVDRRLQPAAGTKPATAPAIKMAPEARHAVPAGVLVGAGGAGAQYARGA